MFHRRPKTLDCVAHRLDKIPKIAMLGLKLLWGGHSRIQPEWTAPTNQKYRCNQKSNCRCRTVHGNPPVNSRDYCLIENAPALRLLCSAGAPPAKLGGDFRLTTFDRPISPRSRLGIGSAGDQLAFRQKRPRGFEICGARCGDT